jgi:inhibitor of KinA
MESPDPHSCRFEPLGDQAVLVYCPDEAAALAFAAAARAARFAWTEDVVQAYTSVAVFYDPGASRYAQVKHALQSLRWHDQPDDLPSTLHVIPCCYELGLDIDRVARHTGLDCDQIIALHTQAVYTVYAIGFCPGFPYLGYLPEPLQGVPRLDTPRVKVDAGSVGLTGKQTGIYTEPRPGGWNILGRTPLELVNVADGYFPLKTGDRVRFEALDKAGFEELRGRRIPAGEPRGGFALSGGASTISLTPP